MRVLGVVATEEAHGVVLERENPHFEKLEGRQVEVTIKTIGACPVTQEDVEVVRSTSGAAILPYEFREVTCGDPGGRVRTSSIHDHVVRVAFAEPTVVTVQVVAGGGDGVVVFTREFDFSGSVSGGSTGDS